MEQEETFGVESYVHYINCGDHFIVYSNVKTYQIVYLNFVHFTVCQL